MVWATHASAQAIQEYFPGLSPLLMESSKLQFALEVHAGVQATESAAMAAGLRRQFLDAAGIKWDPARPKRETGMEVPPDLFIVERTNQVVGLLMRVLQIEVRPVPRLCHCALYHTPCKLNLCSSEMCVVPIPGCPWVPNAVR